MRLHDLKGLELYFEFRCLYDIRTRLQGLTVLEKPDTFRVYKGRTSRSHGWEHMFEDALRVY